MGTPYYAESADICWRQESSFGDADGDSTQWETNDAGDTFYPLPILIDSPPKLFLKKKRVVRALAGFTDPAIWTTGYAEISFTLSGSIVDFTMLLEMTKNCSTTGPGANSEYTHTSLSYYASGNRQNAEPPSFEFYVAYVNADTNENMISLCQGCVVKSWSVSVTGSGVTASIEILCARIVAGTALTSVPDRRQVAIDREVTWTFTRGAGTANEGFILSGNFSWDDGVRLLTEAGAQYPTKAVYGQRNIKFEIEYIPYETALIDAESTWDTYPDSGTDYANVTLRLDRDSTTDYIQISGAKLSIIDPGNFSESDASLTHTITLAADQSLSTSALWTITEVNLFDDTGRY